LDSLKGKIEQFWLEAKTRIGKRRSKMANKQRNRSASRSKQQRQGQEIRREANQSTMNQSTAKKRRGRAKARRSPWLLIGGILVVVVAVVGVFVFLAHQSSTNSQGNVNTTADAGVVKEVTNVDPKLLSQIGTGGIANPFQTTPGAPQLLTGPTGKPEVFFYGAEWCPLCAAERWSIAVALSRFGTLQNLRETTSASDDSYPNTSTISFYQSRYSSSYIDFVSVEEQDRLRNNLQTPTDDQQQLLTRNNVTGYPFMDIGERYLINHPSYDPGVLRSDSQNPSSQPLSQQQIADQLSSDNKISESILGTANYLTAAICQITKNQPGSVCNDASIQHIEGTLAQTSSSQSSMPEQQGMLAESVIKRRS
jgi:Domain of unknown function (DUF929)